MHSWRVEVERRGGCVVHLYRAVALSKWPINHDFLVVCSYGNNISEEWYREITYSVSHFLANDIPFVNTVTQHGFEKPYQNV